MQRRLFDNHFPNLQDDSDALKKRMQEVGDSLASIEQELAAVKSETNDSFSRVSTDVDNTGTLVDPHSRPCPTYTLLPLQGDHSPRTSTDLG